MKLGYNSYTNITILTHTQYRDNIPIFGPTDDIYDFSKDNFIGDVFYLRHSLYRGNGSVFMRVRNGKSEVIFSYNFHRNWNNIARYIVDFLYSIRLYFFCKGVSLIIATDPLNFLYAYSLKKIRKHIKKVVFFTVDYGYKHFNSSILNWIYCRLDGFAVEHADVLWNASTRISKLRSMQGIEDERNIYIPNTPLVEAVKVKPLKDVERYTLVIVFSNYMNVDFRIIFEGLKYLVNEVPLVKIKLIGRGNFQEPVSEIIEDRKLFKYIEFLDIHTHKETLEQLSRCAIGLEFNHQKYNWNDFREPLKLREYIYFGLPIISTPYHALVQEIIEEKIGFIVNNSREFFETAKIFLSDYNFFCETRERVLKLAGKYSKEKILRDAFTKLGIALKIKN